MHILAVSSAFSCQIKPEFFINTIHLLVIPTKTLISQTMKHFLEAIARMFL
jgi:hypothetical protein